MKLAALTQKALAAHQAGDKRKAERLFREAAHRPPLAPQAAYNLAVFLRQCGRAQEARGWLDRALKAEPGYAAARIELGFAALELDDLDAAQREFEAAGDDAEAQRGLAQTAYRQGQWARAADIWQRLDAAGALTIDERLLLARALMEAGRTEAAQALIRRLGSEDPSLAPDLLKVVSRRTRGGFALDEAALAADLGLRPGAPDNACGSRPADR